MFLIKQFEIYVSPVDTSFVINLLYLRYQRLVSTTSKGGSIHNICLSKESSKGYWISDVYGWQCNGLGEDLSAEVSKAPVPLTVCIGGNGAWIVLRDYDFKCSTSKYP